MEVKSTRIKENSLSVVMNIMGLRLNHYEFSMSMSQLWSSNCHEINKHQEQEKKITS